MFYMCLIQELRVTDVVILLNHGVGVYNGYNTVIYPDFLTTLVVSNSHPVGEHVKQQVPIREGEGKHVLPRQAKPADHIYLKWDQVTSRLHPTSGKKTAGSVSIQNKHI